MWLSFLTLLLGSSVFSSEAAAFVKKSGARVPKQQQNQRTKGSPYSSSRELGSLTHQQQKSGVVSSSPGGAAWLRRWTEQVFDAADLNKDGSMTLDEVYELTLKLYIMVNRQAPIPPPSRETVHALFSVTDSDRTGTLDREEFLPLATLLLERALSRVVAFKMVTLVGAPLLTEYVVHWWTQEHRPWLSRLVSRVVTNPHYLNIITSKGFCRTLLLVLFISTLGNLVLSLVDGLLQLWLQHQQQRQRQQESQDISK